MLIEMLKVFSIICIAIVVGKLISKLKLPSILGWLLTGMIFGPFLVGIVPSEILTRAWYKSAVNIFEAFAGLMIGTEIIFKKLKKYGKQIAVITIFQSLGTFLVVSGAFAIALAIAKLPIFLSFIFGGIALATAPAPALSIVNEFKTKGPVTKTLIPMAALDDVVGVCVFFTVVSIVSSFVSAESVSVLSIILIVLLPFVIGIAVGALAGLFLKKERKAIPTLLILIPMILVGVGIGFVFDNLIFKSPSLNYILLGMAFSATFANIVGEERVKSIMKAFSPILNISLVVVIINLGMPLNYKLIAGAGLFTLIYIVARAVGKIGGAFVGGVATKAEPNIKKFLGLTLLPHSGVSLVFTGIAVSMLAVSMPECAAILQGTIAAAAIINEIIAVILAKQAFKWSGELNAGANEKNVSTTEQEAIPIEKGSVGCEVNEIAK